MPATISAHTCKGENLAIWFSGIGITDATKENL